MNFFIGDKVIIKSCESSDIRPGQIGSIVEELPRDGGYGVEVETHVLTTGANPKMEKKKIIVFVRESNLETYYES